MSIVIQLATPVENIMRGKGVLATWKTNQREMSKHVNLFGYSLWLSSVYHWTAKHAIKSPS